MITLDITLGAWLLSKIGGSDKWYNNLINLDISSNELQNIDIVEDSISNGRCLSLTKAAQSNYKFTLNSLDCNEKRIPICRVDPPKTAAPSKPPKFPCIQQGKTTRRKRGLNDNTIQNGL